MKKWVILVQPLSAASRKFSIQRLLPGEAELMNFIAGTLIPQASPVIDSYCGHGFGTPTYSTITLDGNGEEVLFLSSEYFPMLGAGAGSVNSAALATSNIKVHK